MDFSVVESGYDRDEVDACLADLGEQLARASAQIEAAADVRAELELVRRDANRLHELLRTRPAVYRSTFRIQHMVELAEEEAEEILAQARAELDNARRDAERIRQEAYAEAVDARRDFELALNLRRKRALEADEVLAAVPLAPAPAGVSAEATAAEPQPAPDGAAPNGAAPDGAGPNGAAPNGAVPNGAAPNGKAANGATPNGKAANGAKPPDAGKNGKGPDGGNGSRWRRLGNNGRPATVR
jgi:hypothetical protein